MPTPTLPVYAIVELLIRLADLEQKVGDYKGHKLYNGDVLVKTTGGSITFKGDLVLKQFNHPDQVTGSHLTQSLETFIPHKK